MVPENLACIGKILKAHGLKGEVKIRFSGSDTPGFPGLKVLFIETETRPVPYFVHSLQALQGSLAIVKLEDVNSIEDVQPLAGKLIYSEVQGGDEDMAITPELVGYKVID